MTLPTELPEPDPEARAHSARVTALIGECIAAAGGAIGFDRFMELVLYAPGLGYYSAGARKFGAAGDFVTAPEISTLFAPCVAAQVAAVLGERGDADLLEVGAGSGALAAALLDALAARGASPRRYLILERSAELRLRQRQRIGERSGCAQVPVSWIDELPEEGFHGVMLGNEVLDAIPARRFRRTAAGVEEAVVECRGTGFGWGWRAPRDRELGAAVASIEEDLGVRLPQGYVSELAPARDAFVATLGERLEHGLLLLLDYGYPRREFYHAQRTEGTLMCHYRHRAHPDPFLHPGLQDLSVHVDFTAVALAGERVGLTLAGYTTQSEFLLASGVLESLAELDPGSSEFYRAAREVKLLTLPGQMGDLVKVVGLSRGWSGPLPGFAGRDLRARL